MDILILIAANTVNVLKGGGGGGRNLRAELLESCHSDMCECEGGVIRIRQESLKDYMVIIENTPTPIHFN